jgi:hypothetical protein
VRGAQAGAAHAGADGLADAELLPKTAGHPDDAKFEDGVDVDLGNDGLAAGGRSIVCIGIDDAVNACDQTLQGGAVELVGAAEAVDHASFRAPGLSVPIVFGEGVVGDRGAIAVSPLGDTQIHA